MFILIFEQLVKMFFIMLLAFICYRIGLVSQEGNKSISSLLLMVINPCLIITVYQTEYDPELVRGLLYSFITAAVVHIIGILITTLLIRQHDTAGVVAYITGCLSARDVNIAFMRLYRESRGKTAYTVIETDGDIPAEAVEEIRRGPEINSAMLVKI